MNVKVCFQAFGREDEKLEEYLRKGFVEWSPRVTEILNDGVLLAEKVRDPGSEGFVTALLAGNFYVFV